MTKQQKNQLLVAVIFGLSIIPFLIALGLNHYSDLLNNRTNRGELIVPVITTQPQDFSGFDTFSQKNIAELQKHWLLVNVIPGAHCHQVCLDALLKTRQLRLMLNKDLSRTRRVVLVFDEPAPEASMQWWLKDALLWRLRDSKNKADSELFQHLQQEKNLLDAALLTRLAGTSEFDLNQNSDLIRVKPSSDLIKKLQRLTNNGQIADGMLLLVDPLGNVMMHYQPGFDPYEVKNDLMHLLRVSQIG